MEKTVFELAGERNIRAMGVVLVADSDVDRGSTAEKPGKTGSQKMTTKPITMQGEIDRNARRLCDVMLAETLDKMDWGGFDPDKALTLTLEEIGAGRLRPIRPGENVKGLCV